MVDYTFDWRTDSVAMDLIEFSLIRKRGIWLRWMTPKQPAPSASTRPLATNDWSWRKSLFGGKHNMYFRSGLGWRTEVEPSGTKNARGACSRGVFFSVGREDASVGETRFFVAVVPWSI